ncbi:MAG TPA: hypothetical protein VJS44_10515 [Pyrinomonadaceae bacterium]|nr:hypothetical protein [Pyrinomonadaceae bacterium]
MSQAKCSCASFERLEGASVPAYIKAFLEPEAGATDKDLYRCRVCGHIWERRAPDDERARASLVRHKSGAG